MRKLLLILSTIATLPLSAQEVRPARVIKKPEEKKSELFAPAPTPRPGLMERIFGRPENAKAKPTPTPTPTPAPAVKPKAKITKPKAKAPAPRVDETPEPAVIAKPLKPAKPVEAENPAAPAETPVVPPTETEPPKPAPNPKTDEPEKPIETPKPATTKGKGKNTTAKTPPANKPDLSNLDEAGKYQAVKALALADEKVLALKTKADSAIDANEAKEASLEYNRALFKKIRALEPSLDAYVDRLEQAVIKRVK